MLDLEDRRGVREMREVEGGETGVRMYSMKK